MKYTLRYLPLFEQDLLDIVQYMSDELYNPEAAKNFIDKLEKAILQRAEFPFASEPDPSTLHRKHPYYRIYVDNYTVYYVIIDDNLEIRRVLYSPRNIAPLL